MKIPDAFDTAAAQVAGGSEVADPMDRAAAAVVQGQRTQLRSSLYNALMANPDMAARSRVLGRQAGLPADLVERNLPDVERSVKLNEFDRVLQNSPTVAQWLADPGNAKVAHDDVDNMGAIERAVRYMVSAPGAPRGGLGSDMGRLGSAGVSGLQRAGAGAVGVVQYPFDAAAPLLDPLVGRVLPGNPLRATAQGLAGWRQNIEAQAKANMPKSEGNIEAGIYSGVGSLASNLAALPLAFLPGGQGAALTAMVAPVGGQAYGEARDKGQAVVPALTFGASQAAIEYATERLPLSKLLGDVKAGSSLAKTLAHQVAAEVPGEQVATVLQDLNEWAVLNPGKPFRDYLAERPSAAAQTLVATLVGAGGQVAVVKGVEAAAQRIQGQAQRAQQAEQGAKVLEQLQALAQASKLRERDPQSFKQFVEQAAEDGPVQDVFVSAQTFAQAAQEAGLTDEQLPASVREQLPQALATGGDLRIPLAEYQAEVAPAGYAQGLLDHLKVDPAGMTRAEAQVFMQSQAEQLQAEVERTLAEREQDDTFKASMGAVRDTFAQQLAQANRFTPEVNQTYATLLANFYAVTAAKVGMTPEALAQRYQLRIQAEGVTGAAQSFDQAGANRVAVQNNRLLLDGADIGMAEILPSTRAESGGNGVEISRLYIDPEHQRRGAGGALIDTLFAQYRDADFIDVYPSGKSEAFWLRQGVESVDAEGYMRITRGSRAARAKPTRTLQQGTGNRGQIAFGQDITQAASVITLFKNADLSTFLHEAGHFFLEVQFDLASRIGGENAVFGAESAQAGEQELLADTQALLQWFGVGTLDEWYALPMEEKRVYHEQFARGFEAYLFEGKAPSIELQGLFQRFAAWLKNIYRDLKRLNVELTDEVRDVMDRMLATGEQIKLAEQASSMMPLFTSPEQAGMTPEEFAAYQALGLQATQDAMQDLQSKALRDMQWLANARGREIKKLQKEAAAKRRELAVEARREIMSQPIYRAWQFLTGKAITPDDDLARMFREAAEDEQKNPPALIGTNGIPLAEGGALFTSKEAAQNAKALRPTTRVVKADGGWALVEKSDKQLAAEAAAAKRLRAGGVGQAGKPMAAHELIASRGGLSPEARADMGVDGNVRVGTRWLFAAPGKGLSIERAVELLRDYGYTDADDHSRALALIKRSITDPQFTAEGTEQAAEDELQARMDEEMPGLGLDLSALDAGRLDLDSLKSLGLPAEVLQAVVDLGMTDTKAGIHPDLVAEEFGFSSGDELARTLAVTEAPGMAIEALTDQKLLEQHGELASPEAIERAADLAIHNDARARFVATELNMAQKALGKPKVLATAAREFAAAMIGRLKVRHVRPGQYASAEARAAKAAAEAMKAGNLEQVAAEKRNQLVNNYAAKAAHQARAEVEKALRYLKRFDSEGVRKNLDADYLDQIDALLERFDLRTGQSLKAIDKRKSLAEWVKSQQDVGIEVELPEQVLAEAFRQSYKELTVDEMRALVDSVKQIEHLAKLKNRLLTAANRRAFEAVRDEMSASITANANGRKADTRTPTTNMGRWLQSLKNFGAAHIKAGTWARIMDGGKDGGPVWEYLVRPANDRGNMETTMRADATAELSRILQPVLALGKMGGKGQFFPSIGRSLNREARLAIALNVGNEGNLQRLLGGEGWTLEQIGPVLQSLSTVEWQTVQAVWDHFESYRPQIAEKERRVYGKEPAWVDPAAFSITTADGTEIALRGGYYPIKYDPAASQRAEEFADAEGAKRQLQGAFTSATTRRSFTKTRADEVKGRPLLYTLAGMYSGVNDVIHDLAWHEWLIDANRLLRSHDIDTAIRQHYGPAVKAQFKTWVADVAEGERGVQNAAEQGAAWLRQSISAAGMGFNVMSAAIQITGFNQSIVRVGARWVGKGIGQYIASPVGAARSVVERSAFMADRSRTQFRELNELRNRVQDETPAMRAMRLGTYFLMMRMQKMVDVPTWLGAYEKAIAAGNDEGRAIALADQSIIDAQGSGMTKDLSAIERGGPLAKLFTVFYSYMNTALNMGVAETMTEKSRARLAVKYIMLYTVPVVLGHALKSALTPGGDDDEDAEALARKLAAEQLAYLMGLMVFVREAQELAKIATGADGARFGYQGPAGLRMLSDVQRFGQQAAQGEFDEAFVKSSINLLGDLTGLPAAQINRTLTGTTALVDGETDNPAAVVFGYDKGNR